MKATALIKELQQLVEQHGDLECYRLDDYDHCEEIKYASLDPEPGYEDVPEQPIFTLN